MSLQAKAAPPDTIGIYLHVPFCATTCDFCAFYQEAPQRSQIECYLDTLIEEMHRAEIPERVETVFIGGGTPGILMEKDFEKIFAGMRACFDFRPDEISVELAPSTVRGNKAKALRALGVNRISMGVQSFDSDTLHKLGRRQDADLARRAYDHLREAGFDNLNLDLMFAYPGQTAGAWQADMQAAIDLGPEHISTYCLTFEEDTKLWVQLNEGKLRRDIGDEAERYLETWSFLPQKGYRQYEISNFAQSGFACRHNLNTWRMGQWRGLGPSAASQYGQRRWANPADLAGWAESVTSGKDHVDMVDLNEEVLATDAVIFGLRMNKGVNISELIQRWPGAHTTLNMLQHKLDAWVSDQLIHTDGYAYRLTSTGRLQADAIGAELL